MLVYCKNTLELYVDNDFPILINIMSAISQDGCYNVKLASFNQRSKDDFLSLE